VRALAVVAVLVLALVAAEVADGATHECKGLQVCVPVAGPWVVVPTADAGARPQTTFVLSCPKNFVVGGLDAELSAPDLDISFDARLGSPVNPGISTSQAAIFRATKTRPSGAKETFRPHVGCMPAAGGGGPKPRTGVSFGLQPVAAVYPPGRPTAPLVHTIAVRAGRVQHVAVACARGTHLVDASRAVGFLTQHAPSSALAAAVTTTLTVSGNRASATVHNTLPAGTRAVVQVAAICTAGGGA
jgi:hypothetical protein